MQLFQNRPLRRYLTQIKNFLLIELDQIYHWLRANKLTLNTKINKFQLITFKNSSPPLYLLPNGVNIGRQKSVKYLGLHVDDKLFFKSYINFVCSDVSKLVGLSFRLSYFLSKYLLLRFYD